MKSAAPPEVAAALPRARLVGSGPLRFFGLSVYEARLWVGPGFEADAYSAGKFALEIEYFRALSGQSIAERSIAEMRRVGAFDAAQASAWLELMLRAFPDIVVGDRLTGAHDGAGGVHFHHNGRLTASTVDARFATLFFGIWLSPKSSSAALRHALLGSTALVRP